MLTYLQDYVQSKLIPLLNPSEIKIKLNIFRKISQNKTLTAFYKKDSTIEKRSF